MLHYLTLFLFVLSLVGCGTTTQLSGIDENPAAHNDYFTKEKQGTDFKKVKRAPQKRVIDNTKAVTYNEYRRWREKNDPDGQTYAKYKAWEAAYNRWKKEQEKTSLSQ